MPRPQIVPFRAEHLCGLTNRDTVRQDHISLALEKELGGPAFTGLIGETILGCAGLVIPWPGVGIGWMVLSEGIGSHRLWMTRMVKRFLYDATWIYRLHRIEAVVLADNLRNQQWIESLGFSRENGAARRYTSDGADVIRYERLGG